LKWHFSLLRLSLTSGVGKLHEKQIIATLIWNHSTSSCPSGNPDERRRISPYKSLAVFDSEKDRFRTETCSVSKSGGMMEESATLTQPVSAHDHAEGPADAPLTLVEYGDYQCPYCGAAYPVVKRLQKTLGKKMRFVFRNFPLTQMHPYALVAAEAAEAAALQGKFWEMHDLLFEQQAFLDPDVIPMWAERIGLNLEQLGNDIRQGVPEKRIKEDRQSGIRSGVNGTPTFFINGARYDGPTDYDSLLEALKSFAMRDGAWLPRNPSEGISNEPGLPEKEMPSGII
jgi:protein-disulfide isomerase